MTMAKARKEVAAKAKAATRAKMAKGLKEAARLQRVRVADSKRAAEQSAMIQRKMAQQAAQREQAANLDAANITNRARAQLQKESDVYDSNLMAVRNRQDAAAQGLESFEEWAAEKTGMDTDEIEDRDDLQQLKAGYARYVNDQDSDETDVEAGDLMEAGIRGAAMRIPQSTSVFGSSYFGKKCNSGQRRLSKAKGGSGRCRAKRAYPCKKQDYTRNSSNKCRLSPRREVSLKYLQNLAGARVPIGKRLSNGTYGRSPVSKRALKARLTSAGIKYPGGP